jgi:hypothetical protein
MALRGALTHRKTRRLAKCLGVSNCYALGILEALWHVTAEQCPTGDITSLSAQDLAEEMFYEENPEELVKALIKSGWIDEAGEKKAKTLIVHGWSEHADSTVHIYLAKRLMLFADGSMPRLDHASFSGETRSRIKKQFIQKYPNLSDGQGTHSGQVSDSSRTSVRQESDQYPEPEPEPVPEPDNKQTNKQNAHEADEEPPRFSDDVQRACNKWAEYRMSDLGRHLEPHERLGILEWLKAHEPDPMRHVLFSMGKGYKRLVDDRYTKPDSGKQNAPVPERKESLEEMRLQIEEAQRLAV